MMDYLNTVIVSAIALGVLSLSIGGGRLSQHCRLIISLLLILTVVMPFLVGVESTFSASLWDEEITVTDAAGSREAVAKLCEEKLEERVAEALSAKFSFAPENVYVDIATDASDVSNIVITEVRVEYSGDGNMKKNIEDYLKELLLCNNVRVICAETGE